MKAVVTIKLKTCHFYNRTIDYSNLVVAHEKLWAVPRMTKAVETLQNPTNIYEVQSFLDLCNAYRRFVPSFAQLAAPLNKKLKKKREPSRFELDATERKAVDILEGKRITSPVLALPRGERQYILETDA